MGTEVRGGPRCPRCPGARIHLFLPQIPRTPALTSQLYAEDAEKYRSLPALTRLTVSEFREVGSRKRAEGRKGCKHLSSPSPEQQAGSAARPLRLREAQSWLRFPEEERDTGRLEDGCAFRGENKSPATGPPPGISSGGFSAVLPALLGLPSPRRNRSPRGPWSFLGSTTEQSKSGNTPPFWTRNPPFRINFLFHRSSQYT